MRGVYNTDMKPKPEKKKCGYCQQTKPFTEFYNNKSRADGLTGHCKICHNLFNEQSQARHLKRYKATKKAYYDQNREVLQARATARRRAAGIKPRIVLTSEERITHKQTSGFKYRKSHKAELRQYGINWYRKHRLKILAQKDVQRRAAGCRKNKKYKSKYPEST